MIYVVKRGDNLTRIARDYGTSVARLRSDNGLLADQTLVAGQALVVLIPEETYTVRPGEGLYSISARTGVPIRELIRRNPVLVQGAVLPSTATPIPTSGRGSSGRLCHFSQICPCFPMDSGRMEV